MSTRGHERTWRRLAILGLLLISWAALLARLSDVPPGLQHDQTFNILDAIELLYGRYRLYFPANYGREPLFIYTVAALLRLSAGDFIWGLRLTGVVWGFVGLAATYALARRRLSGGWALLPPALMAGSFWFLFTARVGLRAISGLTIAAFVLYFLDRGLAGRASGRAVYDLLLAGLFGGIGVYTYLSARALLALVPLLLLYMAVARVLRRHQPGDGRVALGLFGSWAISLVVSAPLLLYLRANPGSADRRIAELAGPLQSALAGHFVPLLRTVWEGIGALLWAERVGVPYQYNIPGRPGLSPVLALLFLVGLAVMLGRCFRDERARLWVTALALGLGPALISPGGPLYLRAIIALPLLYIFAVYGLQTLLRVLAHVLERPASPPRLAAHPERMGDAQQRTQSKDDLHMGTGRWVLAVVLAAGLLLHWGENLRAYFGTWAAAGATGLIYNADLHAAATYLDAQPPDVPVYISTNFWLDLDQQTYLLHRPLRRDVGWFYGPRGLPLPGPRGGRYLWLASAPNSSPALAALAGNAEPVLGSDLFETVYLTPETVSARLAELGEQTVAGAPDYGDTLRLEAAAARSQPQAVEVISRWSVLAPWSRPAPPKLSAVLTDATGYVWAQTDDFVAVAYQQWQPGEGLLQVTTLALPADFPGGAYRVTLQLYDDATGALPVSRDGQALAVTPPAVSVVLPPVMNTQDAPNPPHAVATIEGEAGLEAVGAWEQPADLVVGVPVDVHVSWRANAALDTTGLRFQLTATDVATGAVLWEQSADPVQPLPASWPLDQTWRLTHRIEPRTPDEGIVTARLQLCAWIGVGQSCAQIPEVQVTNRPVLTALPVEPQTRVAAEWGGGPALEGYDLTAAGDEITLVLYWRAVNPPAVQLSRFVHAVDDADEILAQADGVPDTGVPMTAWRAGEVIVDRVTLRVTDGAVTRLYVGWYDPATGVRVPVRTSGGEPAPDDRWVIPYGR